MTRSIKLVLPAAMALVSMTVLTGRAANPGARQAAAPSSQPPGGAYVPKQSDRPAPIEGDEPGFQPIFDGKTLSGWEGDPTYWRVENGTLMGKSSLRPSSRATPSSSGAAVGQRTST